MIFAPVDRKKEERVPTGINLRLTDSSGHGLTFSAPVKDLRKVPTDVFETKIPMSPFVQVSDAGMPRSCPASDSRRLACLLSGEDRK
jgi:hypothetical protein